MHAAPPKLPTTPGSRRLFLDFETYYDSEYSLTRMSPPEYILDERFEVICCSVIEDDGPAYLVDGPDFEHWLRDADPTTAVTITHNAQFDSSILAWRFGWVPSTILCTSLLARATIGFKLPNTKLRTVARALGLGSKDDDALTNVKGMRRRDILGSPHWDRFVEYNCNDVRMCAGIYRRLIGALPDAEHRIMDMVLRCTISPSLILDVALLERHLAELEREKHNLLCAAGTTVDELMSAAKFKTALESLGVTVATKVSPTGRTIPALSRTDDFMVGLTECDDPRVQAMAAARLGHKSTIEETRCKRLISIGRLPWPSKTHSIPVPLIYGGTHTHRLSGTWSLNLQNLPRGSELRNAISAPPGKKLIVADFAQIEARLVATLANQTDLVDAYVSGEDVYASFASSVFGCAITKTTHPSERFIGKTAVLGLGYGCGATKFYNMVSKNSRAGGITLPAKWDEHFAKDVVDTYRSQYSQIPALWRTLDQIVREVLCWKPGKDKAGKDLVSPDERWLDLRFTPQCVELPNRLFLRYYDLKLDKGDYVFKYAKETKRLYGGALLENIVQALARIVAMDGAARLGERGVPFAMQVHDEFVFVVPEDDAAAATKMIKEELEIPPQWLDNLPLAVEVSKPSQRYGDAK